MLRPSLTTAAVALLCTGALAQADLKSRLHPVTSPIKNAGVYHVATGKWTRGASLANGTGPNVIYNNSCGIVYFSGMLSTERWQHRSRLPSPTGPSSDSIFYGSTDSAHRFDQRPGCQTSYVINGFEVEYCSSHIGTINWQYQFANNYTACGAADMIPGVTIAVTGLPGGTATGAQNCWIVGIDVSDENGGSNFSLSADGDGTYSGTATSDQFGWSFNPTSTTIASDFTGPIIAGDYTWTGGPGTVSGVLTPCTGTDGTIWDSTPGVGGGPTPAGELLGTGMDSADFFRMAGGPVSAPSGPGCYYFGGNPHADFYLKLYSSSTCAPIDPVSPFCAAGVGGIVSCPCGNPQVPAGSTTGCNNFVAPNGGAVLSGAGTPVTNPGDTLQFNMTGGVGTSVTVLFQGTTNTVNTRTGAGVRCVGGTLKRLYKGNPVAGAISFPNNGVKVHDQSALKGFVINAPVTLFYYTAYRNSAANGQPGCPGLNFGFNSSNAGAVSWTP
jgi:hypothetical protein